MNRAHPSGSRWPGCREMPFAIVVQADFRSDCWYTVIDGSTPCHAFTSRRTRAFKSTIFGTEQPSTRIDSLDREAIEQSKHNVITRTPPPLHFTASRLPFPLVSLTIHYHRNNNQPIRNVPRNTLPRRPHPSNNPLPSRTPRCPPSPTDRHHESKLASSRRTSPSHI
jgi:hypothetical protein